MGGWFRIKKVKHGDIQVRKKGYVDTYFVAKHRLKIVIFLWRMGKLCWCEDDIRM